MIRTAALPLVVLALLGATSCGQRMRDSNGHSRTIAPGDTMSQNLSFQDVLRRETTSLMTIKGVTGTGEGRKDGKPVIIVYTSHITKEARIAIPATIEGYKVEVREIGDVTAPPPR